MSHFRWPSTIDPQDTKTSYAPVSRSGLIEHTLVVNFTKKNAACLGALNLDFPMPANYFFTNKVCMAYLSTLYLIIAFSFAKLNECFDI